MTTQRKSEPEDSPGTDESLDTLYQRRALDGVSVALTRCEAAPKARSAACESAGRERQRRSSAAASVAASLMSPTPRLGAECLADARDGLRMTAMLPYHDVVVTGQPACHAMRTTHSNTANTQLPSSLDEVAALIDAS
jgi:hypothetical protein